MLYLGKINKEQLKFKEAFDFYSNAINQLDSVWLIHSMNINYDVFSLVDLYLKKGNRNLENEVNKSLDLLAKKDTFKTIKCKAYHYHCLGIIYSYLEEYVKSNELLNKSLIEYESIQNYEKYFYLEYIASSLGNNYSRINDFSKSEKYFEKAFVYARKAKMTNDKELFNIWYSAAINSIRSKNYLLATIRLDSASVFSKSISNKEYADLYHCYGLTHTKLGNYFKANDCFLKAIKFRKKEKSLDFQNLSRDYQNYSELLVKMGKQNEAIEMSKESCKLIQQVMGDKSGSTSQAFSSLGSIYKECKLYDESMSAYNKAILAACSDTACNRKLFPEPSSIVYTAEYIKALKGKASILYTMITISSKNNIMYYKQSLLCNLEVIKQLEKLRSSYQFNEGKLLLSENEKKCIQGSHSDCI